LTGHASWFAYSVAIMVGATMGLLLLATAYHF
jgi:hypothetical protein